jgi:O-antigen ligase
VWKLAFENFKTKAITGYGMGSFALMKYNTSSSHWRHAHNEYYQIAFELGIIGLLLLLWCIWEYFRIFKTFRTDLTDRLAVMFSGFCLLGLFTFNAHLWQIAAIGMMSYSFLFTLKNEVAQCQ